MTPLNYTFIKDLDDETRSQLPQYSRMPSNGIVRKLQFPTHVLTPDGSGFFPLVHAYMRRLKNGNSVFRFRVRSIVGGITIRVVCSSPFQYQRYRAILLRLRNTPVSITFTDVVLYHTENGLFFESNDFKIEPPEDSFEPTNMI